MLHFVRDTSPAKKPTDKTADKDFLGMPGGPCSLQVASPSS